MQKNEAEGAQQTVKAPSVTLPKGGGAVRGIGEKFAANPVTGTGSMSIPIAVSPGRSGFGPQLNLAYDSGSGNGPFGFGWSLSLPSITRKTDKGLPKYQDAEETDVFILSGAEDLVPVLREDGKRFEDTTTVPGYTIHRYRPRIEGLFARIERWTDQDTGEIHWRSISRENITTIYGKDNNSRIFDPAELDPTNPTDLTKAHPRRIFSWLICQTYDDKGNAIVYEYQNEDSQNIFEDPDGEKESLPQERNRTEASRSANRYLKRIKYGNRTANRDADWIAKDPSTLSNWMFEVVFDYGEGHYAEEDPDAQGRQFVLAVLMAPGESSWPARQDPFSAYRGGFEVRTYRLCRRILMFHHFPDELGTDDYLVRCTEFAYVESPVASFITSVTQSGYIRQPAPGQPNRYLKKSLPPVEFEYSRVPRPEQFPELPIRDVDEESIENLPAGLDGAAYQWMDLDGEGTSGILTEQADGWYYKRNISANNQVREDERKHTVARFAAIEVVARKPAGGLNGGAQFLDLAGDGQVDLVQMEGSARGFYERTKDADWVYFQPFDSWPNVDTRDPDLKFVDLTGDGHADILVTESEALTWYPSLAEEGFAPGVRQSLALDEERGPRLVFDDGTQSIYLADLSGDGLSDLARIRNGEVCYWPNLGYGRFGAKVTMDNAPMFDSPDQFDQRRIRLADTDGSGTTDILYLHRDEVRIYFNQSGNGWSDAVALPQFPAIDKIASVQMVDLLGNGTACLVWSSPLPRDTHRPMRYIALMEEKPHLLIKVKNNLGAETRVHYAPSTKFYLNDKRDGKSWITRLPFPVHVVERVETFDHISRNRFVTHYVYHHGYFDGEEREFRGFGMVEQFDTEEIGTLISGVSTSADTNWDEASFVPPVLTRTWFHTGAFIEGGNISKEFEDEYYREGDPSLGEGELTDEQLESILLPDTVLPEGLTAQETREACRSLKGGILRQEIYALDGTEAADRPYSVLECNYTIKRLQPRGTNKHGVFFTPARETIDFYYERTLYEVGGRNLADPRVSHSMTLEVDGYGNVRKAVAIGYGRRHDDPNPLLTDEDREKQKKLLITYTENNFTIPEDYTGTEVSSVAIDTVDVYRTPLPYETRSYELIGVKPESDQPDVTNLFRFEEMQVKTRLASDGDHDLPYEDLDASGATWNVPYRRLIEHVRTLYRKNDLNAFLPLGRVASLALPGESYKLAFTPGLLVKVYHRGEENLLPDPASVLGGAGSDKGGYVNLDGDGQWWIPSGQIFYSPNTSDSSSQELTFAREHFFLPHRFRDPFYTNTNNTETVVRFDTHNLLILETRDALDNLVSVNTLGEDGNTTIRNDYRVLQPYWVTDPNGNRSQVTFDTLGMVVATAIMGKPGENKGDFIDDTFEPDLTLAQLQDFVKDQDPRGNARGLLKTASTRIVYDLNRYQRCGQPPFAATLAREIHSKDPGGADSPVQISFGYSDGFGREIQTKVQAEAGDAPHRYDNVQLESGDIQPGELSRNVDGEIIPAWTTRRWVGTGRTVYNNKGKPIKKYEPFFSSTHLYEPEADMTDTGVTPILFYDPIERVVATLHPNHTYEKVVFDAWQQITWDVNDTVLLIPHDNLDVSGYVARTIAAIPGFKTWFDQRIEDRDNLPAPSVRTPEQGAAIKAMSHAYTPTVSYFDTLGRAFLTITHNKFERDDTVVEEKYRTRIVFDIEGNQREVIDAKERVVMSYDNDMLGNRVHQTSMDAGERWTFGDVTGKPIRAWDSRGFMRRLTYDQLRRPLDLFVTENNVEWLAEHTVYGEAHPDAVSLNLRSQPYQLYDGAGAVTSEEYDFKGNPLRSRRQFAGEYKQTADWSALATLTDVREIEAAALTMLESERFISSTTYDALNRPIQSIVPHSNKTDSKINIIQPVYNEANLLEEVHAWLNQATEPAVILDTATADMHAVTNIDYDAKGQRELIEYGNGAYTEYSYDPFTFRLTNLKSLRPSGLNGLASQLFVNPAIIQDLHYTYDPVGNITRIEDGALRTIIFNGERVEPVCVYAYDAIYRLIEAHGRENIGQMAFDFDPPQGNRRDFPFMGGHANPNDPEALRNYTEDYDYDEVGNFQSLRHSATDSSWTRTYVYVEISLLERGKQNNRLTRTQIGNGPNFIETYRYTDTEGNDVHGCMTSINSMGMIWDFKDQLQTVDLGGGGTAYYVYDASGQRARKVIHNQNGARKKERIYLGGFEVYREYNGAGGTTPELERETLHIMDDKQRIALVETKTKDPSVPATTLPEILIRYQLSNHLGSASLELDNTARTISYEEYHPYGTTSYQAVDKDIKAAAKRYRYGGKQRDQETGLYYHGARYYVAWLGRWTSYDPFVIIWDDSDSQSESEFELYELSAYVAFANNPMTFIDPNGRNPLVKWFKEQFLDLRARGWWPPREVMRRPTLREGLESGMRVLATEEGLTGPDENIMDPRDAEISRRLGERQTEENHAQQRMARMSQRARQRVQVGPPGPVPEPEPPETRRQRLRQQRITRQQQNRLEMRWRELRRFNRNLPKQSVVPRSGRSSGVPEPTSGTTSTGSAQGRALRTPPPEPTENAASRFRGGGGKLLGIWGSALMVFEMYRLTSGREISLYDVLSPEDVERVESAWEDIDPEGYPVGEQFNIQLPSGRTIKLEVYENIFGNEALRVPEREFWRIYNSSPSNPNIA